MTFKDALAWEADNVFLNTNEFAESRPVTLNGIPCTAQIIGPHDSLPPYGDAREGVSYEQVIILVSSSAFRQPKVDREIDWNGQKWIVTDSRENMGLIRIEAYRERS